MITKKEKKEAIAWFKMFGITAIETDLGEGEAVYVQVPDEDFEVVNIAITDEEISYRAELFRDEFVLLDEEVEDV